MTQIKIEDVESYLIGQACQLDGTLDASHLQNWLSFHLRKLKLWKEKKDHAE